MSAPRRFKSYKTANVSKNQVTTFQGLKNHPFATIKLHNNRVKPN